MTRARFCASAWTVAAATLTAVACGGGGGASVEPFFPADFVTRWPEVRDCRFSIEHDGVNIVVHASPDAATAYRNAAWPLPVGAVLVKREFADAACSEPTSIVAMRKSAPAPGDGGAPEWEWQRADLDGRVRFSGALPRCINCHTDCTNGRDMTCTDP